MKDDIASEARSSFWEKNYFCLTLAPVVFTNFKSLLLDKPGVDEAKHLRAPEEVGIGTKKQQLCAKDFVIQKAVPKSFLLFQKSRFSQRRLFVTRAAHSQAAEF